MRFRESIEVGRGPLATMPGGGPDRLEVGADRVAIVGSDGARTQLRRVLRPSPTVLGEMVRLV